MASNCRTEISSIGCTSGWNAIWRPRKFSIWQIAHGPGCSTKPPVNGWKSSRASATTSLPRPSPFSVARLAQTSPSIGTLTTHQGQDAFMNEAHSMDMSRRELKARFELDKDAESGRILACAPAPGRGMRAKNVAVEFTYVQRRSRSRPADSLGANGQAKFGHNSLTNWSRRDRNSAGV